MNIWLQRHSLCAIGITLLFFSANLASGKKPQKITLPQGRVLEVLKEQHQIHERKVMFEVQSEISRRFNQRASYKQSAHLNLGSILPICDHDNPPFDWRYVDIDESKYYLTYPGNRREGHFFLSWGGGDWIRLSKSAIERDREGMRCSFGSGDMPNRDNYVQIVLNQNILAPILQKQKAVGIFQDAVLQLSIKAREEASMVVGGIALSAAPGLEKDMLRLELWEKNNNTWKLLKSHSASIGDGHGEMTKWDIEAEVSSQSEVRMILRVDEKGHELIQKAGALGRLYLYDARLVFKR